MERNNLYVEAVNEAADLPKSRLAEAGARARKRIAETATSDIKELSRLLSNEIIEREYTREVVQFQKEKIIKLQKQ